MTIVKAGTRISARDIYSGFPVRRSAGKSAAYVTAEGGALIDSSSDSSDGEPAETIDVHLCQIGDIVWEIPTELLDISDLRRILSLDAWNTLLTEEDRESLIKFLPYEMDEFTYGITLTELFSGENFNFSSPLEDLLQLLRSGQCHPNVAAYRDATIILQHREHVHQLRRYHNYMVNSFLEMQHLWQEHSDLNLEEKLEIWKSWKSEKLRLSSGNIAGKCGRHWQENDKTPQVHSVAVDSAVMKLKACIKPTKGFRTSMAANETALETTDEARSKGVLKLPAKASAKSKPVMQPDEIATQPVLPHEQMQPVISSVIAEIDDRLEKSVSTMAQPVIMSDVDRFPDSVTNEQVSSKLKSENKVKASGLKKMKEMVAGDGKVNGSDTLENHLEQYIDIVKQQRKQIQLSPTLGGEICLSPMHVEKHSPSLEVDKGDRAKSKMKRKIKIEEQSPFEHSDEEFLMKMGYGEEASLAEKEAQNILDDKDIVYTDAKSIKRRWKRSKSADILSVKQTCSLNGEGPLVEPAKNMKKPPVQVPPVALSFPFSVVHLLSAVRSALMAFHADESLLLKWESTANDGRSYIMRTEATYSQVSNLSFLSDDTGEITAQDQQGERSGLPVVSFQEIVKRVQNNPGDPRILETQEPLQGLIRGALKVLASRTLQPAIKGWKPLVAYNKESKGWSWIGPASSCKDNDGNGLEITHETWSVPQKTLVKLQECFANWLKNEQDILQKLGQLALIPPPLIPAPLDEKERFRELRAQKSLITISPTSDEMRSYFRREEELRYSVPDRAFSYTCQDGRKSAVAPLRRIGGKPNSKARDHFMLKSDRPPHVTILCLVRDAAARLPGSIGTRADVCSLIRDSQYIVEDVSDVQLNQVVSGALDRLHYERDPCVRFDGDRKLWVYLHADKDDEDFEEDATSSTKRWKRTKKEGVENPEFSLTQDYEYPLQDDQDSCGLGLDFSPTCFGQSNDLSSIYASASRLFSHPNGSLTSPHGLESAFACHGREEVMLPFIELPPSIQPPFVHMQQSHPMGWEVFSNRWEHDLQFQSNDHIVHDFNVLASHRENEIMIDRGA